MNVHQVASNGAGPHSASLLATVFGAPATLAVGAHHLQQHRGPSSAISTIGMLFVVNFVTATLAAVVVAAAAGIALNPASPPNQQGAVKCITSIS